MTSEQDADQHYSAMADESIDRLRRTLDDLKRCYQKGNYHEIPGPLMEARQIVNGDFSEDSDDATDWVSGLLGTTQIEGESLEHSRIDEIIREHATERHSPLPRGEQAKPEDWNIEHWIIEDMVLFYRVTHSDYSFGDDEVTIDV